MGIYVCMYTWKTRRLSHVCANLVIRPPPGWCLVARPRPPANSDHAREISFGRRKRSTRARICSMDRSRHVFRGTESGKGKGETSDKAWFGIIIESLFLCRGLLSDVYECGCTIEDTDFNERRGLKQINRRHFHARDPRETFLRNVTRWNAWNSNLIRSTRRKSALASRMNESLLFSFFSTTKIGDFRKSCNVRLKF